MCLWKGDHFIGKFCVERSVKSAWSLFIGLIQQASLYMSDCNYEPERMEKWIPILEAGSIFPLQVREVMLNLKRLLVIRGPEPLSNSFLVAEENICR